MENHVAIFLAEGYEMAEAVIIIDILRRANINIDIISINNNLLVKATNNLVIQCEKTIDKINFENYQILILPGGSKGVENLNKNQLLKDNLVKFAKNKKIAAICAAPQILGQLGLINNKKIAFYPGCEMGLDQAIKTTESVCVSDNIITGKSVGCAFEFALAIVSQLTSDAEVQEVKQRLEF